MFLFDLKNWRKLTFSYKLFFFIHIKNIQSIHRNITKKIAKTSQISMELIYDSRLNNIWVINFWSNKNVTFQDKAKYMEEVRTCLWQMTRARNLYNNILLSYLNLYKCVFIFLLHNFVWYVSQFCLLPPSSTSPYSVFGETCCFYRLLKCCTCM